MQRVISHQPPPVAEVRPGISRDLSAFVDRLLAKRPGDRPHSAAEVAALLSAFPEPGPDAWERNTGGDTTLDVLPPRRLSPVLTLPAGQSAGMTGAVTRGRKLPLLGLAVLLLALTGTAGYLLWRTPSEPLRIAVPAPRVPPGGEESFGLLSSSVLTAALSTLATPDSA